MCKISNLELDNNKLHRRLNRADVVLSGMPLGIKCLTDHILTICLFYKLAADIKDINHCYYAQRNKLIIVKFNNIQLRDDLMRAYFKGPKLQLNHVIDTEITARVYLNNNLTPAENKLQMQCRSLRKANKISWFRILNRDVPSAKIKFPDGKEVVLDAIQCSELTCSSV